MKRFWSLILCCIILISHSTTSFALGPGKETNGPLTDNQNMAEIHKENLAINPELYMPVLEKDATNEYDYIVEIRAARKNNLAIANMPKEKVEYITSDAIESELAYRAMLSTDVLKDQYCYSDEAIEILRTYEGERIENNPELRAVTATLSTALGELVRSNTRMGVIYTWSWDCKPLVLWTDYAAMSWEGTYVNGGNNNMSFDPKTSFSTVNYYYTSTQQEQESPEFISDNLYHGAAIRFPAEKYINAWYYWAKYGSLFVYTDLVNKSSGPLLYELNTHAEFAHYTLGVGSGVSFPAGIAISFSGVKDVIGVRNLRIKA